MLTSDYEFLKEVDELAADIYMDKKFYYLNYKMIAECRGIKASDARGYFIKAKHLLKDRDNAWMDGLSARAVNAIKVKYKSYKQLYDDVMVADEDLEVIDGVGHKVAVEVRRWLINKSLSK